MLNVIHILLSIYSVKMLGVQILNKSFGTLLTFVGTILPYVNLIHGRQIQKKRQEGEEKGRQTLLCFY